MEIFMRFRREGEGVVLYREKWGMAAISLFLGGGMTVLATWLWLFGPKHGVPTPLLLIFCLGFCGVGLAILARLPGEARQWFADDGSVAFRADASGVVIAPAPGATPLHYRWDAVSEIALAKTLKRVEIDETGWSRNVLILFLSSPPAGGPGAFERLLRGVGRSADGRACLLVDYPGKHAEEIAAGLRAVAPPGVALGRFRRVVFDHGTRGDIFEAA